MRIVLDVPDWAEKAKIAVFAGVEEIAHYNHLQDPDNMFVKVDRCNQCGDCCRWPGIGDSPTLKTIKGTCIWLKEAQEISGQRFYCSIASHRPITCMYDPTIRKNQPNCSITYKKVPIEK